MRPYKCRMGGDVEGRTYDYLSGPWVSGGGGGGVNQKKWDGEGSKGP